MPASNSSDNFRVNDTVLAAERDTSHNQAEDLLALPIDMMRAAAHTGIQQPINSFSQIFCADNKQLLPHLQIVAAPEPVEPLSARWHAQQFGAALGAAADVLALTALSRGKIKPALAGACFDGIMRPVDEGALQNNSGADQLTERLKNAAIGALTFGTQAKTASYLGGFENLASKTLLKNTIAAVPASFITSAADGANKPGDYLMGAYSAAFTGAGLGSVHKIAHWTHGVAELKSETKMLKRHNSDLEAELRTDTLTGLKNRRASDEALSAEFERATRAGQPISLIFGDLDGFKQVNDTLGHKAGDGVLKHMAEQIKANVRPYDHAARVGGDEFVVILPNTNEVEAQHTAKRLEQAMHIELVDGQKVVAVGASLGVVTRLPNHGSSASTAEDLRQRADQKMYQAKAQRKGLI